MATYRPRRDTAVFETARNLMFKKKEEDQTPLRDLQGVESVTGATKDVADKAVGQAQELKSAVFDTPEVEMPTDSEGAIETQAKSFEQRAGSPGTRGTKSLEETASIMGDIAREGVEKESSKASKGIIEASKDALALLAKNVDEKSKFLDNTLNSSVARGDVGQLSQVEQGDIELAKMMQDPTKLTSNIQDLAAAMPSYDPRLATLQSQLYQSDVQGLRGEAARLLAEQGRAESGLDVATGELAEAGQDFRERLTEYEGSSINRINEQTQDALAKNDQVTADALSRIANAQEQMMNEARNFGQVNDSIKPMQQSADNLIKDLSNPSFLAANYDDSTGEFKALTTQLEAIEAALSGELGSVSPEATAALNQLYTQLSSLQGKGVRYLGKGVYAYNNPITGQEVRFASSDSDYAPPAEVTGPITYKTR